MSCWIDRQFGRALHERRCSGNTAPRRCSPGRSLQLGGDILIRARRGLRAVPRVTVGVYGRALAGVQLDSEALQQLSRMGGANHQPTTKTGGVSL
jgi:hypothetical protein